MQYVDPTVIMFWFSIPSTWAQWLLWKSKVSCQRPAHPISLCCIPGPCCYASSLWHEEDLSWLSNPCQALWASTSGFNGWLNKSKYLSGFGTACMSMAFSILELIIMIVLHVCIYIYATYMKGVYIYNDKFTQACSIIFQRITRCTPIGTNQFYSNYICCPV